ncbi:MAG: glucose 1-dehydrogenase [Gammaproteobacteria bacterium]|nr:glucose 1-dehydrogenase [Gammaproteobacteria bacterium]
MHRLEGRTALITGASRGIGRAIACAYAAEGANLFLTATNADKLEETREQVAEHGVEAACHLADLSVPDAVDGMFAAALRWRDGLDIVVNNAGIYIGKPFTDYDMAEFDRVMKVNVYAVFQLMQLTLRHMRERRSGKIVNIASTAGRWESPNQAAYNTSKHAVVGMTRCAALENAALGINVNAICPGFVETDMMGAFEGHALALGVSFEELIAGAKSRVPMGRFLEPEEIAHIAVYLGSGESDGMTGQAICISGGMRMG